MNREKILKEIQDLVKQIKNLELASRYESIDYDLLEQLERKQNSLMKQLELYDKRIEQYGNQMIEEEDFEEDEIKVVKNKNKEWKVPMNTKNTVIQDKKMDYKMLGLITLISNRKTGFIESVDISDEEMHRYLYEKGTNSILSNKEYLETISNNKYDSIKRNLRKLAKCDNSVVSYCTDENGRTYYKIMPYTVGKNGELRDYVTIDSRVLEYLCNTSSSNEIKVYCILLWVLWDNQKKCYIEKWITRDWLCKQIGLCENSGKNISMIGDILYDLESKELIERRKETEVIEIKGENKIVKTRYYYSIGDIDDFLNKINKHYK